MHTLTANQIKAHYALEPLDQEGGFFRQVWRSEHRIADETLGADYLSEATHPMGTLIYFLLTVDSFSAMHRLPTPEHWFYHLGDPAEMLLLHADGSGDKQTLGPDLSGGQKLQITTPAHSWQGTRILPTENGCGFCFFSCVMVPGFEWTDFEPGDAVALSTQYPAYEEAIRRRTHTVPVKGRR